MDHLELLKEYKAKATEQGSNVDIALAQLLLTFDEDIKHLYDEPLYFHKAFRQIDVVELGEGKIDLAIYCLLNESVMFWEYMDILIAQQ